ncbi:MAG TPA: MotA/TolQ/ExbB proton channel family protein [Bacteroidia bacterium]|jgi:biopolymer transport protein ExbB|nr:MotA/TolQ/ExbB proton channel family protein [Bacteroidia bacterium]
MLNFILLQISSGTVVADTSKKVAAVATAPGIPPVKTEDSLSLLEMVMKGGFIMIPLFILSILAIYFIIERLIVISKASRLDSNFMNNVKDAVLNGNFESAKTLCKTSPSPVARVIEKGISRIGQPVKEIEDAMESVGKLEVYRIEKNVSYLSLIAKLAPMFGFIGTILGVIKLFYALSLTDDFTIKTVSDGLYTKMVSSAGGLVVGILAFLGYFILNAMVEKVINRIEKNSVQFMDILQEPGK